MSRRLAGLWINVQSVRQVFVACDMLHAAARGSLPIVVAGPKQAHWWKDVAAGWRELGMVAIDLSSHELLMPWRKASTLWALSWPFCRSTGREKAVHLAGTAGRLT